MSSSNRAADEQVTMREAQAPYGDEVRGTGQSDDEDDDEDEDDGL